MYVLSIKVPTRKKSGNLSYVPRIYIYIYIERERERTVGGAYDFCVGMCLWLLKIVTKLFLLHKKTIWWTLFEITMLLEIQQ